MTVRRALPVSLLICALMCAPAHAQAWLDAPALSEDGSYRLQWGSAPPASEYEVQMSTSASFEEPVTIYRGPDDARAISGKLNGTYHYRVRTAGGNWSAPTKVEVTHHPLARAWLFLGMGATVFLATAALIALGHRQHRREQAAA